MVAAALVAPRHVEGYLAVSRMRPDRALVERIGLDFCRAHLVCPLSFEHGELVVATPSRQTSRAIRSLEQRIRQRVTTRSSTSGEVLVALANAMGEEARPEDLRSAFADVLVALEVIERAVRDAYVVAGEGEAYLGAALVEGGVLTDAERIEAIGLAFHLPSIDVTAHPPTLGLDAEFYMSPSQPGMVPLWLVGQQLFVGCSSLPSGLAVLALQDTLDVSVQPVLTRATPPSLRSVSRLIASIVANPEARRAPRSAASRFVRLLEVAGFGDLRDRDEAARADAVALSEGLPRLRELAPYRHAGAQPGLSRLDQYGVPLLRDRDLLTIVVESPADLDAATPPGEVARAAIADASGLAATTRAWDALGNAPLDGQIVTFARELQLRRGLTRLEVLDLLSHLDDGLPMDRAVARFTDVAPSEVCAAFATALHIRPAELHRVERQSSVEADATGVALGLQLLDPVDHEVARLLTLEQSDALGALPYGRAAGTLLVAVADLLSASTRAELEALLAEPFDARPAWRFEIAEAARRAHGQPSVGEILLEARRINPQQLERALLVTDRANVSVADALRSLGIASEIEVASAVAQRAGLPFFELGGINLDRETAALLPEQLARAGQMVPIAIDSTGEVTIALADPENVARIEDAQRALEGRARFVVTTRSDVRDALERLYHGFYAEIAATRLRITAPENSADRVLTRPQQLVLSGSLVTFLVLAALWTIPVITVLMAFTTTFYLSFACYKFYLIFRSLAGELTVPVTDEDVAALDDRDLPVYTILVPLYRETEVLPLLVRSLTRLEYPKEKLDVKLLLEEDDIETIAAARAADLPACFDLTIVPHGTPKGKPKACNYGLLHARGDYVVIFDAEDVPDADQLKRVLIAFARSPEDVVCIQAKLSYYNRNQNVLTRWFTAEYALWFDLLLPGLDATGAPIPLGGTSNHFKTQSLLEAGAWDPYNVTEDADLGLRIFKAGGRTAVVDSTTYEEANSVLDNWIRQRSRWVKGYIQTYLVHMRNPVALWRAVGPMGFLSFQLMVGGTAFSFLFNPVLWLVTILWFATHWAFIYDVFPPALYYVGTVSLVVGNFTFAYANVVGCLRRRYYPLVAWALLSPLYWVLMSVAAWKGFLQLFYRPFYWEKTVHGLATPDSIDELARMTDRGDRTP